MEDKLMLGDVNSTLRERVFFAARDGMSLTLYALLYEKNTDEIDDLLNSDVCCDGVKCTPLIASARHGREGAVRILLDKFRPPVRLETEGTVKFDEYVIEGATALWCAAGAGHLGIVKRLVRAGANVNHATKTLSTPLRAACFDGRLDIVKYLVRHGADIHKANKYNNTCLMIAAYKGHLDVVQFLLDSGARVDERALCGATALHFAAECGHAAVVCALIEHNAKILTNENGMTPLQCAAERARASVVELLAGRPEVTRPQAIEAFELLGASFANDKEYYCLRMAYQYLRKAMAMRYDTRYGLLLKKPADPIPAYDNWKESTTLQEVERLHGNAHGLHMEGLAVRERVLGRRCPDLPHPIVFRGAVFADEARFDRCLALWRHALLLRQHNSVSVVKDLLRFAQVFSQMIHIGIELPLDKVCYVLEACAEELRRGTKRLETHQPNHDPESLINLCRAHVLQEEYESNVRTALYLVAVAARLLENDDNNEETTSEVRRAIFRLRDARLRSGQTLLHLAADRRTPVDDFHTSDVCQFPCPRTTRLLLECGVAVDAADDARRTALHVALISYQLIPDSRAQWAAWCSSCWRAARTPTPWTATASRRSSPPSGVRLLTTSTCSVLADSRAQWAAWCSSCWRAARTPTPWTATASRRSSPPSGVRLLTTSTCSVLADSRAQWAAWCSSCWRAARTPTPWTATASRRSSPPSGVRLLTTSTCSVLADSRAQWAAWCSSCWRAARTPTPWTATASRRSSPPSGVRLLTTSTCSVLADSRAQWAAWCSSCWRAARTPTPWTATASRRSSPPSGVRLLTTSTCSVLADSRAQWAAWCSSCWRAARTPTPWTATASRRSSPPSGVQPRPWSARRCPRACPAWRPRRWRGTGAATRPRRPRACCTPSCTCTACSPPGSAEHCARHRCLYPLWKHFRAALGGTGRVMCDDPSRGLYCFP
ncbi:protein fem-1 homolog B isoform X3 [Cydia pomonella]|uniref:protein fem-1 homolog B isoform X3 n=1 Tax=Cydia pomonella TaxID=82600 RepID=UPI002ADDC574|nr:protein fem-1 homolog B isoform X3 [Cydia pomonella]